MPCNEVNGTGRYRFGRRGRVYDSKAECEKVQAAVHAKKRKGMGRKGVNENERDESAKG